jgi:hypothetical protein
MDNSFENKETTYDYSKLTKEKKTKRYDIFTIYKFIV